MQNIVTDFDGTVTDIVRESTTFVPAYLELFALKFRLPQALFTERFHHYQTVISAKPGRYGWKNSGVIVAPATADPYLYTQTASTLALTEMAKQSTVVLPESDWDKTLTEVFALAYASSGVFFRPYAKEYLQTLNRWANLTIVTNSRTDSVLKKLVQLLGPDHGLKVVGNAQKFKLDMDWLSVPSSILPHGFPRRVYLRRRLYAETLHSLGSVDSVCGDIYELDLLYPEYQGLKTVLLLSPLTPDWERSHYQNHPFGFATDSLESAQDCLLPDD